MPQLDPAVFLPQIFWLVVIFGLIYLFITYNAAPRITEVLERRQSKIASDLEEASDLQVKADEARILYEKSLEQARAKAASTITTKREAIKVDVETQYNKLSEKITAEIAVADEKIKVAKEAALDDVQAMAADICKDVILSVSGLALDEKVIAKVVGGKFTSVKGNVNG
ncbi:MAG: hypothetical protein K9G26_09035 [Emcibacter sp.]|nr:hypothetical protein [Emcibacter sp.]